VIERVLREDHDLPAGTVGLQRGALDEHPLLDELRDRAACLGMRRELVDRVRAVAAREERREPARIGERQTIANVFPGDQPQRLAVDDRREAGREPRAPHHRRSRLPKMTITRMPIIPPTKARPVIDPR
jgi:hypothetical protein